MMTLHENLRALWQSAPKMFSIAQYAKGRPVPGRDGWSWQPWPGDLGRFAGTAASELLAQDPLTYPLDICDFALKLRRIMALEALNLPVDPHSLHIARLVESLRPPEETSVRTLAEDIAALVLNLGVVRTSEKPIEGRFMEASAVLKIMDAQRASVTSPD